MRKHIAKDDSIRIHGISEREVCTHDIPHTSGTCGQVRACFLGAWILRVHYGNVAEATIRNYIKVQEEESYKENWSIK